MELATSLMDVLRNPTGSRLTALQSLAGKLNFLYTHLRPEVRCHLYVLQKAITTLCSDKLAQLDLPQLNEAVTALVDYGCHRVPGQCMVAFQDTHATLIVVDANQASWSAVCLAIVTLPEDQNKDKYPDTNSFIEFTKNLIDFPAHLIPRDSVAVPVRTVGGRFTVTQQRLSSTWRERAAMIKAVHELQAELAAVIIVACDNQNCSKVWHNIDESFSGELALQYTVFQELHHYVVWIPRDGLPSLADQVARLLDEYVTNQKPSPGLEDQQVAAVDHSVSTSSNPLDHPLVTPNLPVFAAEIASNYDQDESSSYTGIPMKSICNALLRPADSVLSAKTLEMIRRRFTVKNGMVCYISDRYCRYYVPKFLTSNILDGVTASSHSCLLHLHHEGNGPHVGETASLVDLLTVYWWPSVPDDVARFVGSCITCRVEKASKRQRTGVLSSTSLPAYRPFGFVMIDFLELKKPKQHILLIVCCYSKYCIAIPTPDETALTTSKALYYHLFMVHGVPERIHSDQGTSFTGQLTRELVLLTGIKQTFSISRRPEAQGMVERHVQEVKRLTRTVSSKTLQSWPHALNQVMAVINFRRDGVYGFSPYEIAFGRAPSLLTSLILTPETLRNTRPSRDWIFDASTLFYTIVSEARVSRLQRTIDEYTLAAHPSKIKVGDRVLLAMTYPAPGKTDHQVSGPYLVLAKKSHNIYDISDEVWEWGRPPEENMKIQTRSEMQLRPLDDPGNLRDGLPRDSHLPPNGEKMTQSGKRGRPPKSTDLRPTESQ